MNSTTVPTPASSFEINEKTIYFWAGSNDAISINSAAEAREAAGVLLEGAEALEEQKAASDGRRSGPSREQQRGK